MGWYSYSVMKNSSGIRKKLDPGETVTPTAGLYVRISQDQRNGLGVERQEELCRDLAARKGWEVAGVYADNDISAYSGKHRPAYDRMLSDLEAGVINAVVCVDLDRLTRRPAELEEFITIADRLGTYLANVSGDIDLNTSDGRFRARILGAVARQESEKKSERIRRQVDQHRSKGAPNGGHAPYGFRLARREDGLPTYVIEEKEAARVRQAIDDHLAGKTLNQIVREWNAAGHTTTRGNRFRANAMRIILTNPANAGLLRLPNGELTKGNWEGFIDRADYEAVRGKAEERKRKVNGRPARHLLAGLVRCHYCGGGMYWHRNISGIPSYVHSSKIEAGPCPHPGLSVNASETETLVIRAVLEHLNNPEVVEAMSTEADPTAQKLEQAEAALHRLVIEYSVEEIIPKAQYLGAKTALETRISELRSQLAMPAPKLPEGDPLALWAKATTEERHQMLRTLIERVVVTVGQSRVFDSERIAIIWR